VPAFHDYINTNVRLIQNMTIYQEREPLKSRDSNRNRVRKTNYAKNTGRDMQAERPHTGREIRLAAQMAGQVRRRVNNW